MIFFNLDLVSAEEKAPPEAWQAEVGEENEQQAKLEEQFRKVCRPYRHVVVKMCQVLLENNSLSVLDPHSSMHSGE